MTGDPDPQGLKWKCAVAAELAVTEKYNKIEETLSGWIEVSAYKMTQLSYRIRKTQSHLMVGYIELYFIPIFIYFFWELNDLLTPCYTNSMMHTPLLPTVKVIKSFY